MKTKTILTVLITASLLMFSACDEEESGKPVVSNLEVGVNDSIHAGNPIHLEFYVEADELLSYYRVIIHSEEEHDEDEAEEHEDHKEWSYDSTFYEIEDLRNYTVHHHAIVVDTTAEEGNYHFHLQVVDQAGNLTLEERELILTHEDLDHDH